MTDALSQPGNRAAVLLEVAEQLEATAAREHELSSSDYDQESYAASRLREEATRLRHKAAQEKPDKPWLTDSARIGKTLIWSWADVGKGAFGEGYRAAQTEVRGLLGGERGADNAQPTETESVTTADRAAALGMTSREYRAASHRAAIRQIQDAARGLYATEAIRVLNALDGEQPEAPKLPPMDPAHILGIDAAPEQDVDEQTEAHRLALSEALGLGTGAPWDTIQERAAELAVLPAPVDRAALLRQEADQIRAHCPDHLDSDSAPGAWMVCHCDVADDMMRRLAGAPQPATEAGPRRGDAVEQWLKAQRDAAVDYPEAYQAADGLLDLYRLHADTGTPLGEHVCEGRGVGDCDCLEQPETPEG